MHEHLFINQPYTYLYKEKTLVFIDKRIKNVEVRGATGLNIGGREGVPAEWYVPQLQQKFTN